MGGSADDAQGKIKKLEASLKQKIESAPRAKAIMQALKSNTDFNEREILEQMTKAMVETGVAAELANMSSEDLCHLIQETYDSMCCVPGSRAR